MKGYKVFNPDWTCRGFQYEVEKTFAEPMKPTICECGFHFCEKPADCFRYYDFDPNNKVAEVEATGEIDTDGIKTCTNRIRILREVSWEEVLKLVNTGKSCTGLCNSGNRNSGNRNSGDWNNTSFSSGCFNTQEAKILMFNKPSDWTFRDWINSDARHLLNQIRKNVVEWIDFCNMTDEEKKNHPEAETTGGYLKVLDESENAQIWWDDLTEYNRNIIKALPNFDKEIFEQIVGVKI